MADFDEIFRSLKTGAENAGKGVGRLVKFAASSVEDKAKNAKLRYGIHGAEERKKANFEAIGEAVYNAYSTGAEQDDFTAIFEIIDALNEEIADLKGQLGED